MTYREVIEAQRKRQLKSRNWWSMYFYHFTDIRNALSIIEKGWIYARHKASEEDLMVSDTGTVTLRFFNAYATAPFLFLEMINIL